MNKQIFKIFEYAYLVMFILSVFMIISSWETDRSKANLFMIFAVVSLFMYLFRRRFRKKMEKRDNK
jgi:membrane protein implicated in regulation of membrane protease activity